MEQDNQERCAIGANPEAGVNARQAVDRQELPSRTWLVLATVFYLFMLLSTRTDVLLKSWPDGMLPIARIELIFPTTNGHLIALFLLALAGALHVRARHKAIRMAPELVRSERGISYAGPLSREHLSLGWSIAWPLQLLSILGRHAAFLSGANTAGLVMLGWALLLAPFALAGVLLRRSLRRQYDMPATGLAWSFLWRFALVFLATGLLRLGVVAAIFATLDTTELPLHLWVGIWALQILAESFGFGWAGHQAVAVRQRARHGHLPH